MIFENSTLFLALTYCVGAFCVVHCIQVVERNTERKDGMEHKIVDKISDWAELISDRLVKEVECVLAVERAMNAEDALECVLSNSCAGPKSIELARKKLGI